MSQYGVMGWCDHCLPGGDAVKQQGRKPAEGLRGDDARRGKGKNRSGSSYPRLLGGTSEETGYNVVPNGT